MEGAGVAGLSEAGSLIVAGAQTAVRPPDNMVWVEGGTFHMGSNMGEDNEKPVHEVRVKGFYMSKYEVTQKEWREVMGTNPSNFKCDDLPVENVSGTEAVAPFRSHSR